MGQVDELKGKKNWKSATNGRGSSDWKRGKW